ncbi:MAG: Bifunctional ligase/repressor BirA [Chlamydiales bacterium]|nr:Bifunctional ligase/repressor BirA [Chlamydiales bacterium]
MEILRQHFKTLGSTNDWGKQHLDSFDREILTLITADTQSKARGQYGRKWMAEVPGNLNVSFCFFIQTKEPLLLTHLLLLSLNTALKKRGIHAQVKLPNDLLVNQKKIAGILCEVTPFDNVLGVVLGWGLNVNLTEEQLACIDQPATSVLIETGQKQTLDTLLEEISTDFARKLAHFKKEGFAYFQEAFENIMG